MKVSIITATYNCERSIEQTTRSILLQDYANFEHVVIDNCSTDRTENILRQLHHDPARLKFISAPDKGIADAFNKGIAAATGEIIAILNSDDRFVNDKVLSLVVASFTKDPRALFVHGNIYFEDEMHGSNLRRPLLRSPERGQPFQHPAFFVRREFYERYGVFDITYRYAMDFELFLRLYQGPDDCIAQGVYLDGEALVLMRAGGASYNAELLSIKEVIRALKSHDLWTVKARFFQTNRHIRVRLKNALTQIGGGGLIKAWRNRKWRK
ncbi:MAG: glycosyltransferase [Desulfobulbaceae bacterium]|nr:glycosyltransferase [Desulfobulbaceae bacterium]